MTGMDLKTIQLYNPNAPAITARYEQADMCDPHRFLLAHLPSSCSVLEVGAEGVPRLRRARAHNRRCGAWLGWGLDRQLSLWYAAREARVEVTPNATVLLREIPEDVVKCIDGRCWASMLDVA